MCFPRTKCVIISELVLRNIKKNQHNLFFQRLLKGLIFCFIHWFMHFKTWLLKRDQIFVYRCVFNDSCTAKLIKKNMCVKWGPIVVWLDKKGFSFMASLCLDYCLLSTCCLNSLGDSSKMYHSSHSCEQMRLH